MHTAAQRAEDRDSIQEIVHSWRDYTILLIGALATGLVVAFFALATDEAHRIFFRVFEANKAAPLLITPLAFAAIMWIVLRYFPGTAGSGVPQTIAAQHLQSNAARRYLLGPHILVMKIVLVMAAMLAGASVGREGPSVQIGAAVMLFFATIAHRHDKRTFIMAGAAAGFAAAFNTPIAGIAFFVEEIVREKSYKARLTMITVILAASIAAINLTGDYHYFGYIKTDITLNSSWLPVIVLGLICGVLGSGFNLAITKGRAALSRATNGFDKKKPLIFAAICGLALALICIASDGMAFGSGYEIGYGLLHGETPTAWWHPVAKIGATILSALSGVPGGTISPSLSIGVTIGGAAVPLFPDTPASVIMLLAMAGYFAGFTQSPFTAAVIALEITGKATAFLPLLAVALIAATISRIFFPAPIYHFLAEGIVDNIRKKKR